MIWIVGVVAFILGVGLGIVLMALIAAKKVNEINSYWYSICLGMTDGEKMEGVLKEVSDGRN